MIYKYPPSAFTGIRRPKDILVKSIVQQSAATADLNQQFVTKKRDWACL